MLPLSAIRPAVRRALAAAALAAIVMPVHAQERPTTTEYPEEVIVTGSRIRRVDTETPSPVQMVDRADIERTGRQNISEVLRGLISADNQGSIPTAFSGGFASGSSAVSLRGLGVNSTLVLLNGRRMATYGLADDGSRTFVDLNVIPLEAVERVEVLKDGGSALYGSDAVAGVVNIITRERYEGFSVGGSYGATEFNDGDAHRIHGSAGFSGDNYNVFVVAEQSSDDAISQADRLGLSRHEQPHAVRLVRQSARRTRGRPRQFRRRSAGLQRNDAVRCPAHTGQRRPVRPHRHPAV